MSSFTDGWFYKMIIHEYENYMLQLFTGFQLSYTQYASLAVGFVFSRQILRFAFYTSPVFLRW